MQSHYQKAMSFFGQALNNSSERSEESRVHKVGVNEILRYALDDKMIKSFYFGSSLYHRLDGFFTSHQYQVTALPVLLR